MKKEHPRAVLIVDDGALYLKAQTRKARRTKFLRNGLMPPIKKQFSDAEKRHALSLSVPD